MVGSLFFKAPSISSHSLLACCVSADNCDVNLIDIPSYVNWQFYLTPFSILSLSCDDWMAVWLGETFLVVSA